MKNQVSGYRRCGVTVGRELKEEDVDKGGSERFSLRLQGERGGASLPVNLILKWERELERTKLYRGDDLSASQPVPRGGERGVQVKKKTNDKSQGLGLKSYSGESSFCSK